MTGLDPANGCCSCLNLNDCDCALVASVMFRFMQQVEDATCDEDLVFKIRELCPNFRTVKEQ